MFVTSWLYPFFDIIRLCLSLLQELVLTILDRLLVTNARSEWAVGAVRDYGELLSRDNTTSVMIAIVHLLVRLDHMC